jgi:hypothetical protein
MKNKEKEKLWLTKAKEHSKVRNWKFKSYFIFKVIDNLYFVSNFFIDPKENSISVWVEYKTVNIDNVFWDIIGKQANKNMPLSFRGEAAFCVRGLSFYEHKILLADELNPESEINELLLLIDRAVTTKASEVKTLTDYRTEMLQNEKRNTVGVITFFIEQGQFDNALMKIAEYKEQKLSSGFGFGDKDFYDLATEYCFSAVGIPKSSASQHLSS